jgi:hypothetical protein
MNIFAEVMLFEVLETQKQKMLQEIQGEPPNKLLNVNESDYVKYLADKYQIEPIAINFDALQISYAEAMIPVEKHPWNFSYASKQEEDLRDFLLMTLCTHYPNTTGETFNKKGKTDILVRHEGTNVFVGECKFWKGLKAFHETIDQVLSYLTWRDSKAAIICFVNNKELGPVLEQISTGAPQHPCFIRLESKNLESWTRFEFRLKSDPTRNVHLAVLCFHFPPSQ